MKDNSLKTESSAPRPVGIWIRVSTDIQVKGDSPEHHEARGQMYAQMKGWKVVKVYRLAGLSGKSVKDYPETKEMLEDIKAGRIKALIFSKLARLARNTKELLEFAEVFEQYRADLVSLDESIDTSSPAGRFFYTVIAAMAQWEREEIATRVAASVPIRAKLGKPLGGAAPFGYMFHDRKLVPDPKEAPVRKLIYELFTDHKRKKTVARLLNQAGHRTRNGSKFSDTTVDRLLRDPIAKGIQRVNYTKSLGQKKHWVMKPKEDWIFRDVEPIVSKELWEQCNRILDGNRAAGKKMSIKTVHLFSGLTYCACGKKMYKLSDTPKYGCLGCRNKIGTEDLEEVFREQLRAFFLSPDEFANQLAGADKTIQEKQDLLKTLQDEEGKLRASMDKVMKLYLSNELSQQGFGREYQPLEERLSQLEQTIPELQAEIDFLKVQYLSMDEVFSEAKDLYSGWQNFSPEEKRRIIESTADRITIGKEEVQIQLSYQPASIRSGRERATQRQGFIDPASMKLAGYVSETEARDMVTIPSSIGWRSTSRASLENSGISSKKSTP